MKQITLKVILSIIVCSILATAILGILSVYHNKKILKSEIETKLLYAAQKYANEFSSEFLTQESTVKAVSATASAYFDTAIYKDDRPAFLQLNQYLDRMMKETITENKDVQCVYITFNPKTSGGNDEIWYIRKDGKKIVYMTADNKQKDWLVEYNHETDYYFEAIKRGSYWTNVEYDVSLDTYSITYAKAIYDKNHQLIGVAGTDIFLNDIMDTVENIQLNEGGQAILLDQDKNYIVGSSGTKSTYQKHLRPVVASLTGEQSSGLIEKDLGQTPYFITYASLSNGWTLALLQPEHTALAPIKNMIQLMALLALLIVIGIILYAIYFSKKSVAPIVYEVNRKDLIMHHQSRQAKLGEMVGNIAHQWKQPLNVVNITLSNMYDDYNEKALLREEFEAYIKTMRLSIKTMSTTIDDFTNFLKPDRRKERFSINKEFDTALTLMAESIKINRIQVNIICSDELFAVGYRNEFCQGIFNILSNARDAVMEADPPERSIDIILTQTNDRIKIEIANKGNPIPEAVMPKLFDPYFTTKNEKEGVGIGLYLTKEIIEDHFSGRITFVNNPDGVNCIMIIPTEEN